MGSGWRPNPFLLERRVRQLRPRDAAKARELLALAQQREWTELERRIAAQLIVFTSSFGYPAWVPAKGMSDGAWQHVMYPAGTGSVDERQRSLLDQPSRRPEKGVGSPPTKRRRKRRAA